MSNVTVDDVLEQAAAIRRGEHETIKPGQPIFMGRALVDGDTARQGDLYLRATNSVSQGYELRSQSQLVPGETQGSKHCLESLEGIEVWFPPAWGQNENALAGPVIVAKESDAKVIHPVHGPVTIAQGLTVECVYQREYDAERRRERRNAD